MLSRTGLVLGIGPQYSNYQHLQTNCCMAGAGIQVLQSCLHPLCLPSTGCFQWVPALRTPHGLDHTSLLLCPSQVSGLWRPTLPPTPGAHSLLPEPPSGALLLIQSHLDICTSEDLSQHSPSQGLPWGVGEMPAGHQTVRTR